MKHNTFGSPRPKGILEINEAIEETGCIVSESNATLEHNDDDGEFSGWTAEVRDNETGDEWFSTLGYADEAELRKDLRAAGFTDITKI